MSSVNPVAEPALTPFRNRLSAVWLSYRTRPLAWIVSLVYAAAVIGVFYTLYDPRPPFEQWESMQSTDQGRMEFSVQRAQWDVQRRLTVTPHFHSPSPRMSFGPEGRPPSTHRGKVVQPEDAITIEIFSEKDIPADFWEPGRYPQVETVICYGAPIGSETLSKLIRTYRLKALSVNLTHSWTANELQMLAQADSLEFLSMDFSKALTEPEALSWPRNLRHLSLAVYGPLPLARVREWRQLSRLNVLILNVSEEVQPKLLTPEMIAELDQLPRRPTLYLDTPQGGDGASAVAASRQFQRLAVRPRVVPRARVIGVFSAFILLLIPTAFALYHLSIQSLQPLMLLAPGAAGPHQNYAARIFLLGGAIATGWALYFGVHWTAALAVGVSGLLWYQFQFGTLHRGRGMDQVGFAHPILAAFPLMFLGVFFMVGIALVSFYPVVIGEIDWFLRGQRPWLALTALAGGIFSARNLLRHVVTLQRSAQEAGLGQVPMSAIDLGGWNKALAPLAGKKLDNMIRWNPIMRIRERRIDAALNHGPALTRRQRIAVWMCGLHAHPFDITFVAVCASLLQLALFQWFGRFSMEVKLQRATLMTPAIQVLIMFLMFPVGALWARRRWMSHELLFPLSRRDWKRDWYAMQAYLLLPVPVLMGLFVILDALLGGIVRPSTTEIAWGIVSLIGVIVATWALSLIVATLRFSWLSAVWVLLACLFAALTAMMTAMVAAGGYGPNISVAVENYATHPTAPYAFAGMVLLLLTALVALARRRWDTWEVGRLI